MSHSMKILLFIVAAFFVLPKGEGSEVKDPIDIAMDAAMDRNGSQWIDGGNV